MEVTDTQKYLGKYYIFHEVDCDGKPTENIDDTYLEGRYKSQIYRWDNSKLALDLYTTSSRNIIIPELEKVGVSLQLYSEGDYEYTYLFPEDELDVVAKIVKPKIKGKNAQLKKSKPPKVKKQRKKK
jgi:c-di-GMP-binding flagellar brake protein YcgR